MTDAHSVARDQLRAFVERIERLEEEKKTIADDIRDVYGEAKGMGFDTKILKRVIALRKKDEQERTEEEMILDTYLAALGMLQHDLFDETPAETHTSVGSGRGSAAPLRVQPDMAIQSPRKAAEAVSERSDGGTRIIHKHTNIQGLPETAKEMDRATEGSFETGSEAAEKERKATATVAAPVDLNHAGAGESPATYPEIDPNEDRSEGHSLGVGADANTGGDHVTDAEVPTIQAGGPVFSPPATKSLRPHCRRPENCGGYGSNHCGTCLKASKQMEELA